MSRHRAARAEELLPQHVTGRLINTYQAERMRTGTAGRRTSLYFFTPDAMVRVKIRGGESKPSGPFAKAYSIATMVIDALKRKTGRADPDANRIYSVSLLVPQAEAITYKHTADQGYAARVVVDGDSDYASAGIGDARIGRAVHEYDLKLSASGMCVQAEVYEHLLDGDTALYRSRTKSIGLTPGAMPGVFELLDEVLGLGLVPAQGL